MPPLSCGGMPLQHRPPSPPAPSPAAAPAPVAADGEARVRFTVDLPRSLHKLLKLAAVERELPMTDQARQALDEWLKGLDSST
jgi:hypothetical protein